MGAYHTIDVEAQRKFTLTKHDGWDSVALDRVDEACDAARTADLAAIIMQEGLANICFVTSSMTVQKQKVGRKACLKILEIEIKFSLRYISIYAIVTFLTDNLRLMLLFPENEEATQSNTKKL